MDDATKIGLRGAEIVAYNDSSKFVAGLNSDQNGVFITANIKDPRVLVEVSLAGYKTRYMSVSATSDNRIDLGTILLKKESIELNEVVVTGEAVMQKPDRYVILPSETEIKQSATSLSLLNNLKMSMPGLKVVEDLQSVTVDNKTPVFKINGKTADMNKVLGLNNENILRIEYFDSPDIRYNNYVINFVLKPRSDGGSVVSNLSSAVTTGFINGNIGATYYNKKSEWNVNYSVNWRDYNKRYVCSDGIFNGGRSSIRRIVTGLPSKFGYTTNSLSLGYTYMYDPNTMFSVSLNGELHKQHVNDASETSLIRGTDKISYKSAAGRLSDVKSPDLDLFFRKQFKGNNVIEANAYTSYNSGDYSREYEDVYELPEWDYNILSDTKGKAWSAGGELMYSKGFRNFTTSVGIQDRYSHANNDIVENGTLLSSDMDKNRFYFYGNITGRIKKLGYSVGLGGLHIHASDGISDLNAMRFKGQVNMNYSITRNFSLNYLFMYDPATPTLNQLSEQMQRVDQIVVRRGNMSLTPPEWFRNRIYARYGKGNFVTMLWLSHSRTIHPVYTSYKYISDETSPYDGMFLQTPANGRRDDRFNIEFDAGYSGLFKHLSVDAKIGWDRYVVHTSEATFTNGHVYASLNAALYFGNLMFSGSYDIKPQYTLSGTTMSRGERWNTIKVQYRWNNFTFSATGVNLFTRRGSLYHSEMYSDVHPENSYVYIKNCGNMLLLSASYRLNFGRGFNKGKRTLKQGGVDTGVDINY